MSAPEGYPDAQWHVDATADTGVGYHAVKGWHITCAWCDWTVTTPTKAEGLAMFRAHEAERFASFQATQNGSSTPGGEDV